MLQLQKLIILPQNNRTNCQPGVVFYYSVSNNHHDLNWCWIEFKDTQAGQKAVWDVHLLLALMGWLTHLYNIKNLTWNEGQKKSSLPKRINCALLENIVLLALSIRNKQSSFFWETMVICSCSVCTTGPQPESLWFFFCPWRKGCGERLLHSICSV